MKRKRTYSFLSNLGEACDYADVGVWYTVYGRHRPATLEHPEENPELEVEITDILTDEVLYDIPQECLDKIYEECWRDLFE